MKQMKHFRSAVSGLLLTGLLLAAQPLLAAQGVELNLMESMGVKNSVVGLGLGFVPDYEGSGNYRPVPLINARVNLNNNMYVSLLGATLRANLVSSRTWNAGPQLRYRPARDSVANSQVNRMKDIDAAIELGGFVAYNLPNWTFSAAVGQDISGSHNGLLLDLGVSYRRLLQPKTMLVVNATTSIASSDYMHTYFNVDFENSLRSGLPMYQASGGWKDIGLGVALQHSLTRNWGVAGTLKYTRLLNEAADSPVVDKVGNPNQFLLGMLVEYTF